MVVKKDINKTIMIRLPVRRRLQSFQIIPKLARISAELNSRKGRVCSFGRNI